MDGKFVARRGGNMDKTLIRERFARATSTYNKQALVQKNIAQCMSELLFLLPRSAHQRVWEVGCGTGLFTREYLHEHNPGEMVLNDLCPEMKPCLDDVLTSTVHFLPGDAECTMPQGIFSLIVSCSVLQWLDEPLHFLEQCRSLLCDGGYLAFSLFGMQNLHEVRALSGSALSYKSLAAWSESLTSMGYQVIHASENRTSISFASPCDVLRHLQQTGVTGIGRQVWTKRRLEEFCKDYEERFSLPNGGVELTYHPMYLIVKNR